LTDEAGVVETYNFGAPVTFWRLLENHIPFFHSILPTEQQPVGWVSGGALFCARATFDRVGGFDEQYFLYYEDVDFCHRARKLEIPVLIDPHFSVIHYRGKSQESTTTQKQAYYASQKYYFQKMRPWYESILLRLSHFFLS